MNKVLCHERLRLRGREFGRITGVTAAESEEIAGRVRPGWPRGEAEVLFREEENARPSRPSYRHQGGRIVTVSKPFPGAPSMTLRSGGCGYRCRDHPAPMWIADTRDYRNNTSKRSYLNKRQKGKRLSKRRKRIKPRPFTLPCEGGERHSPPQDIPSSSASDAATAHRGLRHQLNIIAGIVNPKMGYREKTDKGRCIRSAGPSNTDFSR